MQTQGFLLIPVSYNFIPCVQKYLQYPPVFHQPKKTVYLPRRPHQSPVSKALEGSSKCFGQRRIHLTGSPFSSTSRNHKPPSCLKRKHFKLTKLNIFKKCETSRWRSDFMNRTEPSHKVDEGITKAHLAFIWNKKTVSSFVLCLSVTFLKFDGKHNLK